MSLVPSCVAIDVGAWPPLAWEAANPPWSFLAGRRWRSCRAQKTRKRKNKRTGHPVLVGHWLQAESYRSDKMI